MVVQLDMQSVNWTDSLWVGWTASQSDGQSVGWQVSQLVNQLNYMHYLCGEAVRKLIMKKYTNLLPSKTQLHPVCLVGLYMTVICSWIFLFLCCNCIDLERVHLQHLCITANQHYHLDPKIKPSTLLYTDCSYNAMCSFENLWYNTCTSTADNNITMNLPVGSTACTACHVHTCTTHTHLVICGRSLFRTTGVYYFVKKSSPHLLECKVARHYFVWDTIWCSLNRGCNSKAIRGI